MYLHLDCSFIGATWIANHQWRAHLDPWRFLGIHSAVVIHWRSSLVKASATSKFILFLFPGSLESSQDYKLCKSTSFATGKSRFRSRNSRKKYATQLSLDWSWNCLLEESTRTSSPVIRCGIWWCTTTSSPTSIERSRGRWFLDCTSASNMNYHKSPR